MKRRIVLTTLLLLIAAVGGATTVAAHGDGQHGADCSFPYTATDATGTQVTLESKPDRVTTLNPSAAQTMWVIGGKSQVVGVTKFAAYLDGAKSRTNVSAAGGFGVDVEKVVGTEPDLVLAPNTTSKQTVEKLRDANLTVYVFSMAETIDDIEKKTTTIGRLTGNCRGAKKANKWMRLNVQAAQNATADLEDVKAMYPLGGGYVAGGDTFISAMIDASGGTNVVAAAGITGYPQLSDEKVIQLAPEVLVVTGATRGIQNTSPYSKTPAGENNRTVFVNTNYLNQPAPRSVVYSVRNLTTGFHPDAKPEFVAFSEVTLKQETTVASPSPSPEAETETTTSQPGFGALPALVAAMLAAALMAIRRP